MKVKLDTFEKEIERNARKSKPLTDSEKRKIEAMIEKSKKERKARNINIRISENDLYWLRKRSADEGLPYQTLISTIIHKYLTDQLVDEKSVMKAVNMLRGSRR
jgi:predicted DNA binding CopG/RHH family protein